MTWIKIIDIVFCAVLLRFLMGWLLANRQVARLVITLLSLFIFVFVVNKLSLPLTQILTTAVAVPLTLILILMFLPDLRRAFQTSSIKRLFFLYKSEKEEINPSLIHALFELAQIRCGAIIVFPGSENIDPFINGGEEYDARVTKSLILSIFNTGSPRHDGAIIVQRNKIIHVGAVLPLSTSKKVKEEWGTRHLAALGLTESCDATTIVVSEERGTISIAHGGKMRVLKSGTFDAVSAAIAHIFRPEDKIESKRRILAFSIGLWLAALFLASIASPVAQWLNQPPWRSLETDELVITSQAPIYFKNIPENLYIDEYNVDTCRVHLRLPSGEANLVNPKLEITVDLLDSPPGNSIIELTERMLSGLPENWEVSRYEPGEVRVVLAEARTVLLPIEPQFTALKQGLLVSSVMVEPPSLTVRVKDNKPEQGRTLKTIFINLSRITEPGTYTYESQLEFPPSVRPLDGDKEQIVKVTIVVEKAK
jgi:uncharacterized protein (TIGR00159 family)